MKKNLPLHLFVIFFITASFSQSTLAYLQFTYTSDELPFLQGYLNGEPNDGVGVDEQPYPLFSVSFAGEEDDLTTAFFSADLTVGAAQYPNLIEDVAATNSSVTRNEDGSVAAWDFALTFTQVSPQTPDGPADLTSWFVESSYGVGTCNCDRYKYEWDYYIQRPYDTWQHAATLAVLYGDASDPDNWSIEQVDVPAPQSYFLLLSGLLIIGFRRWRRSSVT